MEIKINSHPEGVPETGGGVEDHVHLLVSMKTTDAPADLVRELKKSSSLWARENHMSLFSWQEGYSIFSVSWIHAPVVRNYITNQDAHHHKVTFVDELKRLLEKNGVNTNRNECGEIATFNISDFRKLSVKLYPF